MHLGKKRRRKARQTLGGVLKKGRAIEDERGRKESYIATCSGKDRLGGKKMILGDFKEIKSFINKKINSSPR